MFSIEFNQLLFQDVYLVRNIKNTREHNRIQPKAKILMSNHYGAAGSETRTGGQQLDIESQKGTLPDKRSE